MPTFHDPISAGDAVSESMRTLAHATRTFANPAQTYDVLGNLIATVRSLGQVLEQVASAHLDQRERAFTDAGDSVVGAAHADQAADALRDAARRLRSIENNLDIASQHSGQIAWHPVVAPAEPLPQSHRDEHFVPFVVDDVAPRRRAESAFYKRAEFY